jgi:hypothetical protein
MACMASYSHLLGEGSILHMRLMKQSYEKKIEDMEKSVTASTEGRSKTQHTS